MDVLVGIAGTVLITTALVDGLWTTIAAAGGGPLTKRISRGVWGVALQRRESSQNHRLLEVAGTAILLAALIQWVMLLWAGYFLLFSMTPGAVVHGMTRAPADLWARIYYTGYTLFTLGMGDYVPGGPVWQVLTAVASINGLFIITLSITYFVPVLSAVASKRRLAGSIANLGMSPQEILCRGWDGSGFQPLIQEVRQLTPMIELHTQRHLAYPVLHFFHSQDARTAFGPRLAALSEALLILSAGYPKERSSRMALRAAREAVQAFLETLDEAFVRRADTSPSLPDMETLRGEDLPPLFEERLQRKVSEAAKERRLLLSLVRDDGWGWSDVYSDSDDQRVHED